MYLAQGKLREFHLGWNMATLSYFLDLFIVVNP